MRLDLTPLEMAVLQLEDSLDLYASDLADRDPRVPRQLRLAAIKAFGFTYEQSITTLRQYLEQASEDPAEIGASTFSEVIQKAAELGLVKSDLSVWQQLRHTRAEISHTYNEERAQQVFDAIPAFLDETQYLVSQLRERPDCDA